MLDQLMNALASQEVEIETEPSDILVLYRSANRKEAIQVANENRANGSCVLTMRKNADTPMKVYEEYASRNRISKIIYIEAGKQTVYECASTDSPEWREAK